MGLFDKAKNALSSNFSEETVKMVDYDKEAKQLRQKEVKQPRFKKEKKPFLDSLHSLQKHEEIQHFPHEEMLPQEHEEIREIEEPSESKSSFLVEDDVFFEKKQEQYERELARRQNEDIQEITLSDDKIEDILEVLGIHSTVSIPSDVYLPDDLDDVVFDLQAPYGFEQGQVSAFKNQVENSLKEYVKFLKTRNEDVAKLATIIDRLQVDINNLKFQQEISNGVNIMPTSDTDDIESRFLEARLEIKRLKEALAHSKKKEESLSSEELRKLDQLQDEYSIVTKENDALKEEIYQLKNRLAYFEESTEEDVNPQTLSDDLPEISDTFLSGDTSSIQSAFEMEEGDDSFSSIQLDDLPDSIDDLPGIPDFSDDSELPDNFEDTKDLGN